MQKELLEVAKKQLIRSEGVRLIEKTIHFAPLQFTDQVERHQSDEVGHFHHRNERAELFGKNTIVYINPEDFFSRALQLAKKASEYQIQPTQQAKDKFLEKTSNTVGIIGQPGMGKTTFTEILLKKYAKDCKLYDSKLVFYLKFRDIDYQRESNILQFLEQKFHKDKICDALLDKLESSSETLIIMDGLDEATIDWSKKFFSEIDIHSKNTAEVFIKNILKGTVLSKAKKLITSRPRQLNNLSDNFRPKFCVNITGLDQKAQKQICKDICGDKSDDVFSYVQDHFDVCEDKSDDVFNYVQDHPDLSAYCHVPFNCIFVMDAVYKLKTEKPKLSDCSLPCTLTGILTVVLNNFIKSDHFRKHQEGILMSEKIANFAWDGFKEKKICFDESDIKKADLTKDDLKNMFITISKKSYLLLDYGTENVTYFSHLIMQEFFVALKLLFFMPIKKMKDLFLSGHQSPLDDVRFEMVLKFMFGLCNKSTFKYLEKSFSKVSFPKKQAKFLKKELEKKVSFAEFNDKLLQFLGWIYEIQDKTFTSRIAQKFPDRFELQCRMLSTDFEPFHGFFQSKKTPTSIDSVSAGGNFYGDCWKRFLDSRNWENALIEVNY